VKTPAILQAFKHEILPTDTQLVQADEPVAIGGRRIAGRLRSSGGGVVYLAHDRDAGLVTVKTAHAETVDSAHLRARLRAEAACARRLPESCTARLLHDGTDETPPYLVSEYAAGPSLERVIDVKGPLPSTVVTALATDLARVLEGVHAAKIVHGNLTPANILFTKSGLRLIDFGVAQRIGTGDGPAEVGAAADNPGWLAPELLNGEPPDRGCDIFGWGCVVAYAATGHSPYRRTSADGTPRRQPLDTCDLDDRLRRLIDASIAEDPECRPTAAALTARLSAPAEVDTELPTVVLEVPEHRGQVRRDVHWTRSRALVSALVILAALFVVLPTATEHRGRHAAAPPTASAPSRQIPVKKVPVRPRSNSAAMSLYDAPEAPAASAPRAAPKSRTHRPRHPLWMSCSTAGPPWCSVPSMGAAGGPGATAPRMPVWRFGWTAIR
jgi:serine/threonine protein kinase